MLPRTHFSRGDNACHLQKGDQQLPIVAFPISRNVEHLVYCQRATAARCSLTLQTARRHGSLRLLQHVWKPSLFMSTPVTVIVAVTVCNPTTEVPRSNRTSTELSRLLFVTIEDVVHEDDLRRIRPLKAVVPFDGAVNWSSHHARTESMHQQHTNSVHQR